VASFHTDMSKPSATVTCTVCKTSVASRLLRFSQGADRAEFCSFECMIEFALARIRERREQHNAQLAELRQKLRARKGSSPT
jgi:hypothetical protein